MTAVAVDEDLDPAEAGQCWEALLVMVGHGMVAAHRPQQLVLRGGRLVELVLQGLTHLGTKLLSNFAFDLDDRWGLARKGRSQRGRRRDVPGRGLGRAGPSSSRLSGRGDWSLCGARRGSDAQSAT